MFPNIDNPVIKDNGVKFNYYPRTPDVETKPETDDYFPKNEVETIPSITSPTTTFPPGSGGKIIDSPYPFEINNILSRNSVGSSSILLPYRPIATSPKPINTSPNYNNQPAQNEYYIQGKSQLLAPIPVPNLSVTPLPPLHDARGFHDNIYGNHINAAPSLSNGPSTILPPTSQPLSITPPPPYHTSLSPAPFAPQQYSSDNNLPYLISDKLEISPDNDIEIIKSIPIASFSTTSIENQSNYPEPYSKNPENIRNDLNIFNQLVEDPIVVNHDEITSDENPADLGDTYTIDDNTSDDSNSFRQHIDTTSYPSTTEPTTDGTYDDSTFQQIQQRNLFNYPTDLEDSPQSPSQWVPQSTTTLPITTSAVPPTRQQGTDVKKSKQIQIIVPYISASTNNRPRPFNNFSNWSQVGVDSHVVQESKVVHATQRPDKITTTARYLTKILAKNIHDLLRREKEQTQNDVTSNTDNDNSIDFAKLQSTIDDWTEQEFGTSSMEQKASTISLLAPSKHIPQEYLTTTPIPATTPTTIRLWPASSAASLLSTRSTEKVPIPEKSKLPQRMLDFSAWENLGITISPVTHEKVHVVTPQRVDLNNFKSPRFIIRPTPGVPHTTPNDVRSTLAYSGMIGFIEFEFYIHIIYAF